MNARFLVASIALALLAPAATSQTPSDTNVPPRGVVILDTSYSMSRCKRAATNLVATLLATGLNGRLASGDRVAFWTFDERVRKPFPIREWSSEGDTPLVSSAIQYLRGQRFIKRSDAAALARELVALRQSVPDGVVALITDGEAAVGGTAFDRQINDAFRQNRRNMRARRLPFVIMLSLRNGQFAEWAVHSGEAPQLAVARVPTEAPQTAPLDQAQPEPPQSAKVEAPVPTPSKAALENPPVPQPTPIAEKRAAEPLPAKADAENATSSPATAPALNLEPDTAQPKANPTAVENTQLIPAPSQPVLPATAPSTIPNVEPEKFRDEPAAVPSGFTVKPNATPAAQAIAPPSATDTAHVPNVAATPTESDASTSAANTLPSQSTDIPVGVSDSANSSTSTNGNGVTVSSTALVTPAAHARNSVALWITGAACLVLAVAALVLYGRLARPRRSSLISQSLDRERR